MSAFWCSYLTVSVAGFGHFRKRMVSWEVYFGVVMANPVCSMPKLPICAQERTLSDGRTVIWKRAASSGRWPVTKSLDVSVRSVSLRNQQKNSALVLTTRSAMDDEISGEPQYESWRLSPNQWSGRFSALGKRRRKSACISARRR